MFLVKKKTIDDVKTGTVMNVSKRIRDLYAIVNFDADGGEVDYTTKNYALGKKYGTLPNATKEGLFFLGWYKDSEKMSEDTIVEDVGTLTAMYESRKEYTPLEYVQFSSTQWIDTGIPSKDISVSIRYQTETYLNDAKVIGDANERGFYLAEYSNQYYFAQRNASGVWIDGHGGSWNSNVKTIDLNVGDNHEVLLNGTVIGSGYDMYGIGNVYIGKRETSIMFNGKVMSFKIYSRKDGKLLIDLIPAKDQDVVCFYDNVQNIFFRNSGTGNLIPGPEITEQT